MDAKKARNRAVTRIIVSKEYRDVKRLISKSTLSGKFEVKVPPLSEELSRVLIREGYEIYKMGKKKGEKEYFVSWWS